MATLIGTNIRDVLTGGIEDDLIQGLYGDDQLRGGDGADTLEGGPGMDRLQGEAGADVLRGGADADYLYGDAGDDLVDGGDGHDNLYGGEGNDTQVGGQGSDTLYGGSGDDSLDGGAHAYDYTAGRTGWGDAADYANAPNAVRIDLGLTVAQDTGWGRDTLVNIEAVVGSAFGDVLTGSAVRGDELQGGAGDDSLTGLGGDDILEGGAGADTLLGGDGDDTIDANAWPLFDPETAANLLLGEAGKDTLTAGGVGDTLLGGAGDDYLRGAMMFNLNPLGRLVGGDGNDSITGSMWDAEIDGGAGNDEIQVGRPSPDVARPAVITSVSAGDGDDRIWVSLDGAQRFVVDGGSGVDALGVFPSADLEGRTEDTPFMVHLDAAWTGAGVVGVGVEVVDGYDARLEIWGAAGAETLSGSRRDDTVHGGDGDDLLAGDTQTGRPLFYLYGDDQVFGDAGNDTISDINGSNFLRGGLGDDSISGGAGFDDAHGNEGNDTVRGGQGDDWVVGGKDNDLLFGDDGGDIVYGNLGSDTLDGGGGADVVRGGQADDVLNGGAGDDWISGDRGADTVTGGLGADTFHMFAEAGIERVTDFSFEQGDKIAVFKNQSFSISQVGDDTVLDFGAGNQMIIVGVPDWWFTTLKGWLVEI